MVGARLFQHTMSIHLIPIVKTMPLGVFESNFIFGSYEPTN
jgi:hypothetical protein